MSTRSTPFDLTGKVVVAHPSRVAQADQIAAREGVERVVLRDLAPTTHAYVIDLDELLKLPEDFRV